MKNLILPLLPPAARPYAKAVMALVAAVLVTVAIATGNHTLAIIVEVLGALGVYAQPNADTGVVLGPEADTA